MSRVPTVSLDMTWGLLPLLGHGGRRGLEKACVGFVSSVCNSPGRKLFPGCPAPPPTPPLSQLCHFRGTRWSLWGWGTWGSLGLVCAKAVPGEGCAERSLEKREEDQPSPFRAFCAVAWGPTFLKGNYLERSVWASRSELRGLDGLPAAHCSPQGHIKHGLFRSLSNFLVLYEWGG